MQVVFAGTPEFASQSLAAIINAGYSVPLVLTQPDRPAGRGMRLTISPVKKLAQQKGIKVCQPRSLRLDGKYPNEAHQAHEELLQLKPDLIIVAAYGLILPKWVLELPKYGCLNIHASLLPRWRGAAPIQRAIESGDTSTGITIMQMDEGLDTGDMLLKLSLPITQEHTAASLHDELAVLGAEAILQALKQLPKGNLIPQKQPQQGVTYAEKLVRSEAVLDFNKPAAELERRVRAFNPFPGTTVSLPGIDGTVKVWQASLLENNPKANAASKFGDVLSVSSEGIDILTSDGILRLLELQRPGGRRQPVKTFIQGWSF